MKNFITEVDKLISSFDNETLKEDFNPHNLPDEAIDKIGKVLAVNKLLVELMQSMQEHKDDEAYVKLISKDLIKFLPRLEETIDLLRDVRGWN